MAATVTDQQAAPADPAGGGQPPSPAPRIYAGKLISATSALLLLALLFGTKWYGVAGVPDPSAARPAISTAENGWDGLTVVRWVILATIAVALGSLFLLVSQRGHGAKTDTSRLVTGFGALTSVLLIYRVLIVLPAGSEVIDQKLGAVLGLLCALGIAVGGYESIEDHRAQAQTGTRRSRRRTRIAAGRLSR
jgi:hypothetical protein